LLRSANYIGDAAAVRADVFARTDWLAVIEAGRGAAHELYLRATEGLPERAIRHVPAVLWHLPLAEGAQPRWPEPRGVNPVAAQLGRLGIAASVEAQPGGHFRVRYRLPASPPLVSIVVPTRDAVGHLAACVGSVLERSSYQNYELVVVDNQSRDPAALDFLRGAAQRPRVRVLRYDAPFNFSAINNYAAAQANGDVLCLLNNDTEVITPDWLDEMLGHLLQPGVAVVGAKLYYSDGRVQHAGDTVGPGGCAHHLHSLIEHDAPGYCDRAVLAQDLSAVTAACLMTWRARYLELGGLDERNLPVAFNDVDYCLRVREAGYRVVWTPYAELYHHESVSRGKDDSPEKVERARREVGYMRRRWEHVMQHDPFYNPNLSYQRPDFSLSNAPMVAKPWRN
jgi:GT2 family glycosyltransferase